MTIHSNQHKNRKCQSDSSSSSNSSSNSKQNKKHDDKWNLGQIYQYFKNRLIEDNRLMIAGSGAYANASDDISENISQGYTLPLGTVNLAYNIDRPVPRSAFHVRESGVYIIFVVVCTDNACQFTVFVNEEPQYKTTIGVNTGAGQVVQRHILLLNEDDGIDIRNYSSSSATVNTNLSAGGTQNANDATFLLMKIASLNPPCANKNEEICLTRGNKKLFKKLTEKLLCDFELMPKGFNVTGSFYNIIAQTVNPEADIIFATSQNVNSIGWSSTVNPQQITILEDGVYKVFFLASTGNAAQLAFTVNDVPIAYTNQGTNHGAGEVTIRGLLVLKKGDIVTVRNHTSAVPIQITQMAGGFQNNVCAELTIFKIAPIVKPCVQKVDCEIEKHYECHYEQYVNYLLCKEYLQIAGSQAYISMAGSVPESLISGQTFNWGINQQIHDIWHKQGTAQATIQYAGIYDIFGDVLANQPQQLTMFVNDVPNQSTIFGRDSGAGRTLQRQFVKLCKGDKISVNKIPVVRK